MGLLNFIKNIIKPASAKQAGLKLQPNPAAYHFHEDFYCQIEYLPKENFTSALKIASGIKEHSENTFDGNGWTGCYIRNEADVPTKSKNIDVKEFTALLLKENFTEYPEVTTGYGSAIFPCYNTRAFKKRSVILCFDFREDSIINIWHDQSPNKIDNDLYKGLLLAMANKYDLLLADWWKSIVVDISNPKEIDNYFVYEE